MRRHESALTVMVVEDSDDVRWALKQFLKMKGYRVVEAADGSEAIDVARRERPVLVLMDLNMPVLDGFSATLRIRELEGLGAVPIVAVTGFDTAEFRAAASAVRCDEFVVKPINLERLAALVERLLRDRMAEAEGRAM